MSYGINIINKISLISWKEFSDLLILLFSGVAAFAGIFVLERRRPRIAIDNAGFKANPYYLDMFITNMSDLSLHIKKMELYSKDVGVIEMREIEDRTISQYVYFLSPHKSFSARVGLNIGSDEYKLITSDDIKKKLEIIFYFEGRIWPNNKIRIKFAAY